MTVKGLEQAIKNLNSLDLDMVPRATAQAVNRIAARAISRSSTTVSKDTRVPRKLVRGRAKIKKASANSPNPVASIRINRGNLPAIKLGAARVQLSRRKRNVRGMGSVLKIGRFSFRNAFVQQLANGRWHVLRRTTKGRYPIEVVKIPLVEPLTKAFTDETVRLVNTDMPKELGYALKNQLRLLLVR